MFYAFIGFSGIKIILESEAEHNLFVCHFYLQLEKQVIEVEQFYQSAANNQVNNSKGSSLVKDKGREKHLNSAGKQLHDASRREAAAAKRMQELIRQFSTILHQASKIMLQLAFGCALLCCYVSSIVHLDYSMFLIHFLT